MTKFEPIYMSPEALKQEQESNKQHGIPTTFLDAEHNGGAAQVMIHLMGKKEDLLPELKNYWRHETTITHPLFQSTMFSAGQFAYVNHRYRENMKRLEGFRKKKDFYQAVFCYTTPHLLDGFVEEIGGADDKTYWTVLGAVWVHTESPWVNRKLFLELFSGTRPHRDHLMEPDERKAFKKLPEQLTIYRGFGGSRGKGLSWTLDRDKAIWFAKRFHEVHGKPGRVIEGNAQKSDAFAYFTRREEAEIVIDPAKVKSQKRSSLKN